ncbi:major capsid protein [Flavobacterium sp. ALJ2]|uniref:major capsid protein n=1 Tax=Flavobacterium sp. ALJ2 TaxID=2786960 RepID=UPI00189CE35A|nr:major capsid protein [Flavobacterium sp. ALJ2]MBF7090457.1 major capsid protein [Flavobacterium sp. ALJ2]
MKESLFVKYTSWLSAIILGVVTKINGGKTELTYLHKSMLTEELSVDLKWSTLTINSTIVAADIVAMDSPLPLKKRDAIGTANGDITKVGMKKKLTEKQLSDIDTLVNKKVENKVIVEKIFNDAISCTMGIYEKMEYVFLSALSTGIALIEDTENVGTGVRIDYGYSDANKFGVVKAWSDVAAKPLDDIQRVIKEARSKGVSLKFMMMDQNTFDNLAANEQVRQYFAFSQNFLGSNIPVPDQDQVNSMLQKRYKLTAVIIDRTVITERDGKREVKTPWATNKVIFLETQKVGRLVYGILAEETRQSKAATYAKAGKYILLKKWSEEEPFSEHTSSQALAIPVIDAVDSIYLLDSEEATASKDTQTDGDTNYLYKTVSYTKASVIAAINLASGKSIAKANNTDATLAKYIDELNEEQVLAFEANIVVSA